MQWCFGFLCWLSASLSSFQSNHAYLRRVNSCSTRRCCLNILAPFALSILSIATQVFLSDISGEIVDTIIHKP